MSRTIFMLLGILVFNSAAYAAGCRFVIDSNANGEQTQTWKDVKTQKDKSTVYSGSYKSSLKEYSVLAILRKNGEFRVDIAEGADGKTPIASASGIIPLNGDGGSDGSAFTNDDSDISSVSVYCGTYIRPNGV
jgi:hypothetical protein